MSVTQTQMIAKVRRRLADASTRRDGTTITNPFHSDATIASAFNDAVRERQPLIIDFDRTFYQSQANYVGVTDAVAATSNEQYALPSDFRDFIRLARSDLSSFPTVRLVPRDLLDAWNYRNNDMFGGFYAVYPENLAPSGESCAILTGITSNARTNRLRILPAPASTSYTYRLFYVRVPTEPSSGSHELDLPDEWQEVIALDTALYLASVTNDEAAPRIERQRDLALANRLVGNGGRNAGRNVFRDVRM